MRSYIAIVLAPITVYGLPVLPPTSCEADQIRACLDKFKVNYEACNDDGLCQCDLVVTQGANCYAACPQEAMTQFIKTYDNGLCVEYDPVLKILSPDAPFAKNAEELKAHLVIAQQIRPESVITGPSEILTATEKPADLNSLNVANDYKPKSDQKIDKDSHKKNKTEATKQADRSVKSERPSGLGWSSEAHNHSVSHGTLHKMKEWLGMEKRGTRLLIHKQNSQEDSVVSASAATTGRSHLTAATPTIAQDAITVTAAPQATTTTMSPEEYRSRLEKQRYKSNLSRIRAERERKTADSEAYASAMEQAAMATAIQSSGKSHASASNIVKADSKAGEQSSEIDSSQGANGKAENMRSAAMALVPSLAVLIAALAV